MLLSWLSRLAHGTDGAAPPSQAERFVPQVEALETLNSVSAFRQISGFTAATLPAEDSAQAGLGFTVNFFGAQTDQVFVNNNGNVTFGRALPEIPPSTFPLSQSIGEPIIAPFLADVDVRLGTGGPITFGTATICGRQAFGVDWNNVGFDFLHNDKVNNFQLILIDRSDTGAGNFDIEFNYDKVQFETGDTEGGIDGLGGMSARVGFADGRGNTGGVFELPGSGVNGALIDGGSNALISHSLLAATAGRYHFQVRNGIVGMSGNNDVTSTARVFFPFRYVFDGTSNQYAGTLTVLMPPNAVDRCLDETGGSVKGVTVVFTALPGGVTLTNPNGFTASGHPFITVPDASLATNQAVRVPVQFSNPGAVPMSTFNIGFGTAVFAGSFNPSIV